MVEIEKFLTLSPAHVSEQTYEWLEQQYESSVELGESDIIIYKKDEYGWFVYVGDFDEKDITEIPPDFCNIVKVAEKHDCCWIQFDRDVALSVELPIFFKEEDKS